MSNDKTQATDGPFAEAREHIGGFFIISISDLDTALGFVAEGMRPVGKPIVVRPVRG